MLTHFSPMLRNLGRNVNYMITCSMYQHPYLEHFKKQRASVSPDFHKQSTGLTGLLVDENPHLSLRTVYGRILKVLAKMPESSVYRQNTEQIVRHRLSLVEEEKDIIKLEEKIGMGQIEEVVVQAEHELQAAREIYTSKAWEPLIERPTEAQWRWPIH